MADESQFHITLVTQKRVRREDGGRSSQSGRSHHSSSRETLQPQADAPKSETAQPEAVQPEAAQAETSQPQAVQREQARPAPAEEKQPTRSAENRSDRSGSQERSSHRRRYHDYGTVDLGSLEALNEEETDFTADPNGPVPTQGELQRQFYKKYDAILNRRYFTRNRNKVTRVFVIVLIVALVFVLTLFGLSSLKGDTAETLERPEVSTIPVETLDLG